MFAIEKAVLRHWNNFWIETDSCLVSKAVKDFDIVPWKIRNRWNNCMFLARSLDCHWTHIHREGNQVANALAKYGQSLAPFTSQWWDTPPTFVLSALLRDNTPFQRITMM